MGSSPQTTALVDHRQRHRLGSRIPAGRTVSGKSLVAWINTVPTVGNSADRRNHLGHHRCHHGGGPCLDWTRSCEDSVRRRAEITRCCNPRRINLRKNDTTQRSSREAPGIRPHNRSHQPSASGSHFDNGVMKVILLLILRASEILQRYSCSIIHVINDHTESGSTHGYPAYTCVPPQL